MAKMFEKEINQLHRVIESLTSDNDLTVFGKGYHAEMVDSYNVAAKELLQEAVLKLRHAQRHIEEAKSAHRPEEYCHIAAWGRGLGSFDSYIKAEQLKAANQNAPLNAIYSDGRTWITADEIVSADIRSSINRRAEALKAKLVR